MSSKDSISIIEYRDESHREMIIELWHRVFGYETAHNEPGLSIDKKLAMQDSLFFVAVTESQQVCGSVMAGYDGHRGWIYSLAVNPDIGRSGVGRRLLTHAEQALANLGCMKVNLQVIDGNLAAIKFYQKMGYLMEPRTCFGKAIPENIPSKEASME